jgi:hypothetical protein
MSVEFEVLTGIIINVTIFWDIALFWCMCNSEDGSDMFFCNNGSHTDYMLLHPGRWQHSNVKIKHMSKPWVSLI